MSEGEVIVKITGKIGPFLKTFTIVLRMFFYVFEEFLRNFGKHFLGPYMVKLVP